MKIVLDAMGSDSCPAPDVEGAVQAATRFTDDTIILVGDEAAIKKELNKHSASQRNIEIVHAPQVVTMDDKPGTVGKAKPNSSMHIGMNLVKAGQADGFVTAGNTGATLSIATLFTLHRIPGVKRPAISAIIRLRGSNIVIVDAGANADAKPDWMAQFAIMGKIYAQYAFQLTSPRVAVLSNGEEEGKGTEQTRAAAELIAQLPLNFIGNIEPKDMLKGGADVVVCDGFVGNILIKSMEAATSQMASAIRDELMANVFTKIGGALSRPAFNRVRKQIDPFETGGAPLLGVNGVVIIGHGRSNAKAINNAIGQARSAVEGRVIERIREGLSSTTIDPN